MRDCPQKLLWLIGGIAVALALVIGRSVDSEGSARRVSSAEVQQAADVAAYSRGAFEEWASLASHQVTSPVAAAPGDLLHRWEAPDHRTIQTVVRLPHPATNAPDVTLPSVPEGADARPYFEAALNDVRSRRARRLVVPFGTYIFKSTMTDQSGHLVIHDLSDSTIDGGGATFVFTHNVVGILIRGCQRVRLANIKIKYDLHMASLATIRGRAGRKVLVVDPAYPVTSDDPVYYVSEFNPAAREWVQGGQRLILPPGSGNAAIYEGDQTYSSNAFSQLDEHRTFIVFHQFYGGPAIRIGDSPGPEQPEDVVIDNVRIFSGPGMGILAYGIKRGLAVIDCEIAPGQGPNSLISTEYDAIHVLELGGDLIIANNSISGQGDDGINLNNPISTISATYPDRRTMVLAPYSRFISVGDKLAFFDQDDRFIGQAGVVRTKAIGGLDYEVAVTELPAGVGKKDIVRDTSLIDSRYVVAGNKISKCNCHGILAQIPNGLVEQNDIRDTKANAIRLLSSTGFFKEGVGAINVVVRGNKISNTGTDITPRIPWAAITVYAPISDGDVSFFPVNKDLLIEGNTVLNAQDACITISSSIDVAIRHNKCISVNLSRANAASVHVFRASKVNIDSNAGSDFALDDVDIDAGSTSEIRWQRGY